MYRWGDPVSEAGAHATRSLAFPLHLAAAPVPGPHCLRIPPPSQSSSYRRALCVCALSRFSRVRLFVTLWMVACQALVHHLVHQGNLSPAGLGVIFRLLGKGKALLPSKLKHVSNCVPKVFSRNFSSGAFILAPWPRPGLSWPLLLVGCVWRCGTAWSGEPVWPEEEG